MPPALLLLAYGLVFGRAALGGGLLAVDDHPGQLYRLYHAVAVGWAPWRLNSGAWAGYAELQYYPPGAAWLGAAIHQGSLGAVGVPAAYQAVLWIAWLLPGVTTFALLTRVLGSAWLALPGAFVALTLSAGSRSGVEEGLRWGLISARLGWGLLPLVALSLLGWVQGGRRVPLAAAPLVAAVILLHPAHAPAALLLLGLGAWFDEEQRAHRLAQAILVLALGLGLSAVWLLPLLVHLGMVLPLAWGDASPLSLGRQLARPFVIFLAVVQAGAWLSTRTLAARSPATRWLHAFTPAMAAAVAVDSAVVAPLGTLWLPADRLVDSLLLALVLGASLVGPSLLTRCSPRIRLAAAAGLLGAAVVLSGGSPEPALTPWPVPAEWSKYDAVVRGTQVDALWAALAHAPPGRVLFLRSSVRLDDRPEWWRPHSHVTALTPVVTGREILNGTFTHPSPIAGLLYTGSPGPGAITTLVEQHDGQTLFGRPFESLGVEEFSRWAGRLRVSAVVASDQDLERLNFLDASPDFSPRRRAGPFGVYIARAGRSLPEPIGPQSWRLALASGQSGWVPVGLAYSPLWRAESAGAPLAVRADDVGMLEVAAPPGAVEVLLHHRPGRAEQVGGLVGVASALLLLGGLLKSTR